MSSWRREALKDVCSRITDGSHFSPKAVTKGYPYITVRDLEDGKIDFQDCKFIQEKDYLELKSNSCQPASGDILFSKDGTVGKVALVDFDKQFVVLSSLAIISPQRDLLLPRYLMYCMLAPSFLEEATGRKTGAAIRRIVLRDLKKIEISFPSLPEQKRIVEILDEAFEEIDKAIANTERIIRNAEELFYFFLRSCFTNEEFTKKRCKFDQVCTLQRGFDLPRRLRVAGEFHLLSSSGKIDTHIEAKVSGPGVVVGRSGSVGSVFYEEDDFWPLNTVLYVKDFHGNNPEYIYWFLYQFDLKKYSGGTGVPTLNRNNLHCLDISVADSIETQNIVVSKVADTYEQTRAILLHMETKLNLLRELKQSLLDKAFTGELTKDFRAVGNTLSEAGA